MAIVVRGDAVIDVPVWLELWTSGYLSRGWLPQSWVQVLLVHWSWDRPLSYCVVRPPGPGIPISYPMCLARHLEPLLDSVPAQAPPPAQRLLRLPV